MLNSLILFTISSIRVSEAKIQRNTDHSSPCNIYFYFSDLLLIPDIKKSGRWGVSEGIKRKIKDTITFKIFW